MNPVEAASPPLSFPVSAVPGYGAAPPASRVAIAIATRRACGPPLTPEPLRPLTAQWHGQAQSPCPPNRTALNTDQDQIPTTQSLYGFRGLPAGKIAVLQRAASPTTNTRTMLTVSPSSTPPAGWPKTLDGPVTNIVCNASEQAVNARNQSVSTQIAACSGYENLSMKAADRPLSVAAS